LTSWSDNAAAGTSLPHHHHYYRDAFDGTPDSGRSSRDDPMPGVDSLANMTRAGEISEATRWTIHGERVVDDGRRGRLSIVEVELPDGVTFERVSRWV
jgi:hypothetical protein